MVFLCCSWTFYMNHPNVTKKKVLPECINNGVGHGDGFLVC